MVGRRKPLVLSSTKSLINSVLNSSNKLNTNGIDGAPINKHSSGDVDGSETTALQLRAGILRLSDEKLGLSRQKAISLDEAALIGLSTSLLKRLSITSGSLIVVRIQIGMYTVRKALIRYLVYELVITVLVIVKNVDSQIQRISQIVALDPPNVHDVSANNELLSYNASNAMVVFPSVTYPLIHHVPLASEVAYVSPLLAFNLGLHTSCLKLLLHHGEDKLASLFEVKGDNESDLETNEGFSVNLDIKPLTKLPRYASHLRVSFVKVPECGTIGSLKGNSSIEAEDRQQKIDIALNEYFTIDRYLSRGDVFSIRVNWSCKSAMCIACSQNNQNSRDTNLYFKVVAAEPSEEPVLRINRTETALVLSASTPSAIPPNLLVNKKKGFSPLHQDTVKTLASIITPTLCPSALSSKFRVAVLLFGLPGCGKRTVVKHVAHQLGLHVVEYSCHDLVASSERKTSVMLTQAFTAARRYSPTILLLRHFDAFSNLSSNDGSPNDQIGVNSEVASVIREFTEPFTQDEDDYEDEDEAEHMNSTRAIYTHPVLLVAAADNSEGLPPTIRRCFSHEMKMGPLTEDQRVELLSQSLQRIPELLPDMSPEDLAKDMVGQTSGFMPRDIRALIADASSSLVPTNGISFENKESQKDIQPPSKEFMSKALERSKKRNASALGTPKVPNVKWEDVGGLEDVKKSILDTVQLPLLHKDLFSSGLRKRSGVLLYGPPGTGKTLLAKAVATECSLNFLSVKGPELINMYIGESEKNVRDIFQKARAARPCVIFFDELDSLAPARGASGDSGGVMDRVVSQMLAEIDGLNDSSQDLFIIGASNRPDLIDAALLRPGRFDKLLYVGVTTDPSYRERVLKALTRKFKLHEDVSLYSIAKKCPPNFTGADMYALCADAWFHAAKRKVLAADADPTNMKDDVDFVVVEYEDFVTVLRELSPSLSLAELKKYEMLRDQFEGASSK
ncbi:putative AAA+ ATPase domain, ATPase, AAA-type, core [Helianthus annuus]|nr:putative AAA+ ATPase domain, ATPase, AAA-type, core [Helianthus annuus]KAJ0762104.1 putative AAA+ ATPase domain, ATPase, AAA-type, core [Helianthus annuus]